MFAYFLFNCMVFFGCEMALFCAFFCCGCRFDSGFVSCLCLLSVLVILEMLYCTNGDGLNLPRGIGFGFGSGDTYSPKLNDSRFIGVFFLSSIFLDAI
eukprot:UN13259